MHAYRLVARNASVNTAAYRVGTSAVTSTCGEDVVVYPVAITAAPVQLLDTGLEKLRACRQIKIAAHQAISESRSAPAVNSQDRCSASASHDGRAMTIAARIPGGMAMRPAIQLADGFAAEAN